MKPTANAMSLMCEYVRTHAAMYAFAYNGSDSMHILVYARDKVLAGAEAGRNACLEQEKGCARISAKAYLPFRQTFGLELMDIPTDVPCIDALQPVEGYRGTSPKAAAFEKLAVKLIGERFTEATVRQVGNLHNSKIDGIIDTAGGRLTIECKYFHGSFA